LRQESGWLFFTSISYLRSSNIDSEFALTLIDSLKANNLIRTPEGVAVWLEVKNRYPDVVLPKSVWKHRDPLNKDEATALADVMKDAKAKQQPQSDESFAAQGAGTWSQQLHFSWDVVLPELYAPAREDAKVRSKRMNFAKFWADVVDSE
jgi:DNA polymerase phi